jgi:ClpP class serine protease
VTAVVSNANATNGDSVVVELDSPGGTVTGYGFAAAQLER